ncbi:2-oxo acid dehydrogenase subunit E2 [Bdellovibrionota bacterium]
MAERLKLNKLTKTPPFRKIAMGTWRTAKDPTVYGYAEIDMTEVNKHLPEYQRKHDVKITPAHLVGKAVAYCLNKNPELNGMLRFNKVYLRENVALFFQVNVPGTGKNKVKKANLSGTTIYKAENLSVAEISKALKQKSSELREDHGKALNKSLAVFKYIPWWLVGKFLDFMSFIIYGLRINLSKFGFPQDPFGSVMITNVGSLGIDIAWAPLCPYTRVPILFTVGSVNPKPVAINDKDIEVHQILPVSMTFDHRFIDGAHAAKLSEEFKNCFAEPEKFLFDQPTTTTSTSEHNDPIPLAAKSE